MTKDYFICYELFYKTGKDLPLEMQGMYYKALMEYGLYGTEPTDPIIKSLLTSAMYSIDKTDAKRKKISNTMKGNQNAVKTFEKGIKQLQTDTNRGHTDADSGKHIEDIEDIEDIKENIKRKYLDFVYLSDDEYKKISDRYGERVLKDFIERVDNRVGEKPKSKDRTGRDHYRTILNRIKKDGIKEIPKQEWRSESGVYELPF